MSAPSTFNLNRVYRTLGVRSRRVVPEMGEQPMSPVAVVADFSDSFAPEMVEARGIAGIQTLGVFGERGVYEILSRGAGGVVIENIQTYAERTTFPAWWYVGTSTVQLTVSPTVVPICSVGGDAVRSIVYRDSLPVASPVPSNLTAIFAPISNQLPMRIFVGPGVYCSFWYDSADSDTSFTLHWREIPEPRGPQ